MKTESYLNGLIFDEIFTMNMLQDDKDQSVNDTPSNLTEEEGNAVFIGPLF